ncbi:aminotransferase, class I/II [Leptospira yanagawae serovar Saopaulo str. Sao Paulo = ATCC 700523]|uniref:alanine transaminase n=1 Tax=Leptospira yanagawae serovar Saopaulo str. Sao Paulo = ATCC 700523 TaxID=1249483 RepID=A0A5E8HEL3_9LEPT|nr:aminotransferase, class I/II [Leptospira yanagawae serovar Saopaulo str. Sao Paulo = ATCC 700523]
MTKENVSFISNRLQSLGDLESENEISLTKKRFIQSGQKILDLTNSNPTQVGLEFPASVLSHILSNLNASVYDPIPEGLELARAEIASEYRKRGVIAETNQIHLTASTSEAYSYLFKLLTNPGDEVLTPNPGYPLFHFLIGFENLKEVHYELKTDPQNGQWVYDAETIASSVSTKTKAIILVSPANPTGSKTTESFWNEWDSFGINLPVIIDEVFEPYDFSGNPHCLPKFPKYPVFVCNGFSKLLALPQTKLAWILNLSPEPYLTHFQKNLSFIADTYLSVNSLIQLATKELLPWKTMIQNRIRTRIMRNKALCYEFVNQTPSTKKIQETEAGWYYLVQIETEQKDESLVLEILKSTGVLVQPGSWYGFSHNKCILVISLITEEETLEKGLNLLQTFLK